MKKGYYITATRSGRELGVDGKIAVHLKLFGKYYDMTRLEIRHLGEKKVVPLSNAKDNGKNLIHH